MNLLIIKTLKDGTKIRNLVNYPTEAESLSAMYYELWYSSSDENVVSVVAELISDEGWVAKCERYAVPMPEPVQESEVSA